MMFKVPGWMSLSKRLSERPPVEAEKALMLISKLLQGLASGTELHDNYSKMNCFIAEIRNFSEDLVSSTIVM
jgi:hypothetical protein